MSRTLAVVHSQAGTTRLCTDGKERPYRFWHRWVDSVIDWYSSRGWRRRQAEFTQIGTRYYGDGGTIHQTGHLDIETFNGKVASVWFRCQPLPFKQHEIEEERAGDMRLMYSGVSTELHGVEVKDGPGEK